MTPTPKPPPERTGPPAFGETPAEQREIAWMRKARADGMSFVAIADHLTKRGVFTKRGAMWEAATVRKVVNAN